ncbi:MAG: agmatinase [Gemmataceae bacterium]|nr:agmatinase [Gemmataceae bacterium]
MQPTLLGVPYDNSSSHLRGSADAPPLIRKALWCSAGNSWCEAGIDLRGQLGDSGDLSILPHAHPRSVIESSVAALLGQGSRPIILGGDHSITYPVVRAFYRARPTFDILHIDAHPDLYEEFGGDRYSHACPFARIMEEGLVGRLVQVGIRTMNGHQRQQAERYGVSVISMGEWFRGTRFELRQPVYLSIDLDALDPAFAPGVSHREPGGLSVREVIDIIQGLAVPVIGADIVEYNPQQDSSGITALVAAKLVKEVAGKMVSGGSGVRG